MLLEEFLKPLGISQNKLAMDIHVPATRIGAIVHGDRAITPDTALRLARYFETSPEFWLNLQLSYDLSKPESRKRSRLCGKCTLTPADFQMWSLTLRQYSSAVPSPRGEKSLPCAPAFIHFIRVVVKR